MKLIRYGLAAALALAVGITVPAFAQHDHGDDHRDKDKDRHERHDARERHEDHERHEAREHEDHGRHEGWERHEAREHEDHGRHEGWERHEAREHERPVIVERRVVVERHYGRISDDHWHSHFGREHRFVIVQPVIVEGRPRFQYGGYWFAIGRPLPPGWRYSDEVYVDYIDGGYYMLSPVHPGVRISINIL